MNLVFKLYHKYINTYLVSSNLTMTGVFKIGFENGHRYHRNIKKNQKLQSAPKFIKFYKKCKLVCLQALFDFVIFKMAAFTLAMGRECHPVLLAMANQVVFVFVSSSLTSAETSTQVQRLKNRMYFLLNYHYLL